MSSYYGTISFMEGCHPFDLFVRSVFLQVQLLTYPLCNKCNFRSIISLKFNDLRVKVTFAVHETVEIRYRIIVCRSKSRLYYPETKTEKVVSNLRTKGQVSSGFRRLKP